MSGQASDSAVTIASGNAEIDALLWDRHWSHTNLTFSFPTGSAEYAYGAQNFGALLPQQETAVREILTLFASVSDLTFAAPAAGTNANLRFARAQATDRNEDGNFTTGDNPATPVVEPDERVGTAYGITPAPGFDTNEWGDMWFNRNPAGGANDMTNPLKGNYAYHTILHEIGHAVGFDHPHGDNRIGDHFGNLPAQWDSTEFTVMTYRSFPDAAIPGGTTIITPANNFPQSLMVLDIHALQYLYGANTDFNDTATTYKWRPTTGNMEVNGVPENAATAPGANIIYRTIWDGGGIDTYDFSAYTTNLGVNLTPASLTDPNVGWTSVDIDPITPTHSPLQRANLGVDASGKTYWARGNIANARIFDEEGWIENAIGGSGNDTIVGNLKGNTLTGGAGHDILYGLDGTDELRGGPGLDEFHGGNGPDTVSYQFETVTAGRPGVSVDLLIGKGAGGDGLLDIFHDIEHVNGSTGHDDIRGNDAHNLFHGFGGNDGLAGGVGADSLKGGGGDDVLDGGIGADELTGDDGIDTASYASASSGVVVDLLSPGGNLGDAAGDHYFLIENLTGSAHSDSLRGDGSWNVIRGGGGADFIDGRLGRDDLRGEAGSDTYFLNDVTVFHNGSFFVEQYDTATEAAGQGIDTIHVGRQPSSVIAGGFRTFYTLGANIENGVVTGTGAFDLDGNAEANALTGNADINVFFGYGGADRLDGGFGRDTLNGGAGDDTYFLNDYNLFNNGTFFVERYDTVVEAAGEGTDTIFVGRQPSSLIAGGFRTFYALNTNIENGVISGTGAFDLDGNTLNNTLVGNAAANVLRGLEGDDFLHTGPGADTLDGGDGYDTMVFHKAMVADWQSGVLDPDTAFSWANWEAIQGSSGADRIRTNSWGFAVELRGGSGNDVLATGVTGIVNDTLRGEAGDDQLNGGAGADLMEGGADNDTYFVDNALDKVVEAANHGTDTIVTSTSFVLSGASSIETVQTVSSAATTAINLVGNAFANKLYGNAASNTLNGAGGADALRGFAGNDYYLVDNAGDAIVETAGQGIDTVIASTSYALAAGVSVETLKTTSAAATTVLSLSGNELVNTLEGNAGANALNGRGGADVMRGFAGNDIYYVDNALDNVIEGGGQGSDTIFTTVSYVIGSGAVVETLRAASPTATMAINLAGNAIANTLVGNDGANILNGGAGGDTMHGLGGDDAYVVDSTADKIVEAAGKGTDNVSAAVSYQLGAGVSVETLRTVNAAATTAINLAGNELANAVTGNAGSNILFGYAGNDRLAGGGGSDFFVFNTALNATSNVDSLLDFNVAQDTIRLENSIFTALGSGAFTPGMFHTGASATQADDRIVYNSATGALIYDTNGSAAGGAIHFATLSKGLALTNADFVVI